ncbi:MAG: tRNA (adenosine(37)-N6)-threonylcarbamoyltransferase complex ATPase subunit type 1 TsaE [Candidatus Omnitrophica bacterium]|nr:tRNA (adenosine(37)-N6)-threonylcarbamoyltransferase complex ATPase subunit type 1 TsaE [Candidatus Omnitrophota bacterium]
MIVKTQSADDTFSLGAKFSSLIKEGDVIIFEGALGGGKTTFIKGILHGLGYKKKVLSPSFTLSRHYKMKGLCVYHVDLYRLDQESIFNWGISDYLYSKGGITLIEWGEKIEKSLPSYIKIHFSYLGADKRKIIFSLKDTKRSLKPL